MKKLHASSKTPAKSLALAIEKSVEKDGSIEIHAIGNQASHKATIALAIANHRMSKKDCYLTSTPYLKFLKNGKRKVTVVRYVVGLVND